MKNIEKYQKTNDALDAYNSLDLKRIPFDIWLECEFEEPREPTLLEAAEAIVLSHDGTKVVAHFKCAIDNEDMSEGCQPGLCNYYNEAKQ